MDELDAIICEPEYFVIYTYLVDDLVGAKQTLFCWQRGPHIHNRFLFLSLLFFWLHEAFWSLMCILQIFLQTLLQEPCADIFSGRLLVQGGEFGFLGTFAFYLPYYCMCILSSPPFVFWRFQQFIFFSAQLNTVVYSCLGFIVYLYLTLHIVQWTHG